MILDPTAFGAWMRAVHGHDPFPWQTRLLVELLARGFPKTLRLPTASGKTTALDVAIFALAVELAEKREPRRMPLRIAYVVDRRIVVDGTFERARRIRDALRTSSDPIVRAVAEALQGLGGEEPLYVALLRGGIYREDRWARQPNQPAIVCSTVDQVGSRLLHRGYGLSPETWPIHAGLLGNDTLIILDEAHCSAPFSQTLEFIARFRREAEQPVELPWAITAMTATPRTSEAPFELDDADREHPVLRARLERPKPMTLATASSKPDKAFVSAAVDALRAHVAPGRTVLVVVNRVQAARDVHAAVQREAKKLGAQSILLTGRARPVERDALVRAVSSRLLAGRDRATNAGDPCLVVVATQCVEVGADLDVDALVTEACPIDALKQRLGRLNRLGALASAPCTIVARQELAWSGEGKAPEDPIYGAAIAHTWAWLRSEEARGALDGGVAAFEARTTGLDRALEAPSANAPIVFPAYCDLWVQTGPVPRVSPDPATFLHGPARGQADVQIVWRADLDPANEEAWCDAVALCPPVASESIAVALYAARAWLEGAQLDDPAADLEGVPVPDEPREEPRGMRHALVWRGPDRSAIARSSTDLRPGDTLVVPVSYGGCDPFGWNPASTGPVADVADEARLAARRAPTVRVHAAFGDGGLDALMPSSESDAQEDPIRDALAAIAAGEGARATMAKRLLDDRRRRVEPHPSGPGVVVIGRAGWAEEALDFADEDDSSSTAPSEVGLVRHLDDVRDVAASFTRAIGVTPALASDLALAGYLHDLGKADPRFQAWLRDGNRVAARRGELLAKSPRMAPNPAALTAARDRAGYPAGGRHELLSVRLAESSPELLARAHDRDLVLHLVESHHGRCRPFAPVVVDDRPPGVELTFEGQTLRASAATGLEALDSGVADRFFRLVRRYGWWGLSYLEACLRLADHRASERAERSA
jgi:CRISPR-associated endonuclease/helicase Cas3